MNYTQLIIRNLPNKSPLIVKPLEFLLYDFENTNSIPFGSYGWANGPFYKCITGPGSRRSQLL